MFYTPFDISDVYDSRPSFSKRKVPSVLPLVSPRRPPVHASGSSHLDPQPPRVGSSFSSLVDEDGLVVGKERAPERTRRGGVDKGRVPTPQPPCNTRLGCGSGS